MILHVTPLLSLYPQGFISCPSSTLLSWHEEELLKRLLDHLLSMLLIK